MRKLLGLTSIFQMCSVNNRDNIFGTIYVIPIETVCLNVAWSARLGQVLPRRDVKQSVLCSLYSVNDADADEFYSVI